MISKDPLDKSFRVSQFSYRYEKEKKKRKNTHRFASNVRRDILTKQIFFLSIRML